MTKEDTAGKIFFIILKETLYRNRIALKLLFYLTIVSLTLPITWSSEDYSFHYNHRTSTNPDAVGFHFRFNHRWAVYFYPL